MEEVGEAIVAKARETLERAVTLIDTAPPDLYDGARVIYGDTDSIFVLFEGQIRASAMSFSGARNAAGATRERAFDLGRQIARDVTEMNPYPMKLKFEKIMQPCVLETKKRYVGNSYENDPHEGERLFIASSRRLHHAIALAYRVATWSAS